MRAVITKAAWEQVLTISRFVSVEDERMASRFIEALKAEVAFLLEWPELSPPARLSGKKLRGIRFRVMRRPFQNYLVFYRLEKDSLVIGAVLWGGMNWAEDLAVF